MRIFAYISTFIREKFKTDMWSCHVNSIDPSILKACQIFSEDLSCKNTWDVSIKTPSTMNTMGDFVEPNATIVGHL